MASGIADLVEAARTLVPEVSNISWPGLCLCMENVFPCSFSYQEKCLGISQYSDVNNALITNQKAP